MFPRPQPRDPRRARVPRADGARGVRGPRREPRRLLHGVRDDRALRLRVDRDVLRDAHGGGERDHVARDARADRQVHPSARTPARHRDPVLLRPGDRFALLVPGLLRRRARERRVSRCARRRRGRRRRGSPTSTWCRRPARTSPATTTCRCSWSTATTCKSQPSLWDALGLRGNQSGPLEIDDVEIPAAQLVGPTGDGAASNDESVDPWFLIGSSSVWNGLALGAIDIAKRHTTRKKHVDVGLRVADYPTIQDYVGEAVMDTNAVGCSRLRWRRRWTARRTRTRRTSPPASSHAATSCTGRGRSSSRRRRTSPTSWTRCSTRAAVRATSATWSSSGTSATRRPAG